jgi:hypothetical protein
MKFNLSGADAPRLAPHNLVISGHHYFSDKTTPFFDLDTPNAQLGHVGVGKNGSEPAPANAPKGQQGEAAVAWLKLTAKPNWPPAACRRSTASAPPAATPRPRARGCLLTLRCSMLRSTSPV